MSKHDWLNERVKQVAVSRGLLSEDSTATCSWCPRAIYSSERTLNAFALLLPFIGFLLIGGLFQLDLGVWLGSYMPTWGVYTLKGILLVVVFWKIQVMGLKLQTGVSSVSHPFFSVKCSDCCKILLVLIAIIPSSHHKVGDVSYS